MLALLLAAALVLPPYGDPVVAFSFADPRIDESSGMVVSSTSDGVVFTHNDSGDEARFFAVDATGATVTTYDLPDVQARDWEDLARGPDEQGRSSLWLGDIGDNSAARDNGILVHRVAEPVVDDREQVTTEAPTSFRLRYPDGPRDAEALMVHPTTGRLYVVTKPFAGPAQVYAAPPVLDADGPNALERVAEVRLRTTGTPGGPGIGALAQVLVTAGDIAPDGSRVAIRTYTDVYEWPDTGDDLAQAFQGEPTVSPLPPTEQGEALAYGADSRSLLTSSEGEGAPVHRLTANEPEREPAPAVDGPRGVQSGDGRSWSVVAAGALVAALAVSALGRRHRRRSRTHE